MLGIVDFLELAIQGKWSALGWFVLGAFCLGLIRVLRGLWIERQSHKDEQFIRTHQEIPIQTLKKKSWWLLGSIVLLFAIILPGVLWLTVEVLKSIKSIDPAIAVGFVFIIFILIVTILIVQLVRYLTLKRRIARMQ